MVKYGYSTRPSWRHTVARWVWYKQSHVYWEGSILCYTPLFSSEYALKLCDGSTLVVTAVSAKAYKLLLRYRQAINFLRWGLTDLFVTVPLFVWWVIHLHFYWGRHIFGITVGWSRIGWMFTQVTFAMVMKHLSTLWLESPLFAGIYWRQYWLVVRTGAEYVLILWTILFCCTRHEPQKA